MSDTATLSPDPSTAETELVYLVPSARAVEVRHGDILLASTTRAVELHEEDVPTRLYIPRDDVRLDQLAPIDNTTFCPFKGVASDYWTLAGAADERLVAWSYPVPFPAFDEIAGYIAFYDWVSISSRA